MSSEDTILEHEPELSLNDFDDVDKSDDNLCFLIYFSGNGDGGRIPMCDEIRRYKTMAGPGDTSHVSDHMMH